MKDWRKYLEEDEEPLPEKQKKGKKVKKMKKQKEDGWD